MQDIREFAKDRENANNWSMARAAYAVAELREAYNHVANALDNLSYEDGWRNRGDIGRTMARIVTEIRAIVYAADLPEEYLL